MAKLTQEDRAFLACFEGLSAGSLSEQRAISVLVKGGYSATAEAAKHVIMDIRETIFAASIPPGGIEI